MSKALGIINFSGNHIWVKGLQSYRPIGAMSFLGRYRVIDFPLSNMSNSGIDQIQVYINQKPRSLTEHIGTANYAQTECQFRYCGTAIPFLTVRSTAR